MPLRTPRFWYENSAAARCRGAALSPASAVYAAAAAWRACHAPPPYRSRLPVICIGNLVAGGSGKTPTALAVMALAQAGLSARPCFLTRGYGGNLRGPVVLDPAVHDAEAVGDEPLLLARQAPVIVSADRAAGARLAEQAGFDLIIMDDGLQNPSLAQDLRLVVVDGSAGFGNRRLLPAGPLRQPVERGMAAADGVVLIGEDARDIVARDAAGKLLLRARLEVRAGGRPAADASYIAFTGLARPGKFRATLQAQNLAVIGWHEFPDHHRFTAAELKRLDDEAAARGAHLITTEKDAVRLPPHYPWRSPPAILPIELVWENRDAAASLLRQVIEKTRP